jgi:hypothetical protein
LRAFPRAIEIDVDAARTRSACKSCATKQTA